MATFFKYLCYVMSCYVASPQLPSTHLYSTHFTSPHLFSPQLTSPLLASPHLAVTPLIEPQFTSTHLSLHQQTSAHLSAENYKQVLFLNWSDNQITNEIDFLICDLIYSKSLNPVLCCNNFKILIRISHVVIIQKVCRTLSSSLLIFIGNVYLWTKRFIVRALSATRVSSPPLFNERRTFTFQGAHNNHQA